MKVQVRFVGAGLWSGDDVYSGDDAPFPRVPVRGDFIRLPGTVEEWEVIRVTFNFDDGLASEPTAEVVCNGPVAIVATVHGGERSP